MVNKRIFVSTSNFKEKYQNKLNDILQNERNYNQLEIASGHITNEFSSLIIDERRAAGDDILYHNYAFREPENLMINLCEEDDTKRRKIIDYIKQMILMTKASGEDYYSIHGGFYPKVLGKKEQIHYNKIFLSSLYEIIEFTELQGIYLGVENHVVEQRNMDKLFLFETSQYDLLFQSIKSPYLMLHLDAGHLKVSANTHQFKAEAFIEKYLDRIMTVHLHDNNGYVDEHKSFNKDAYFLPWLIRMEKVKNIIIETWDQDDGEINNMIRSVEDVL